MYKLIIFDVDGTLVTTKTGGPFRQSAYDWQWLPGRVEKCHTLIADGVCLALASNQAGVAFPWSKFTEAEIRAELEATGALCGAHFVCVCYTTPNEKARPEYHNPNDPRRKPNPGMLLEAMEHFHVSPDETLMVGDRPEDEQSAQAAGVAFQWADDFFK